MLIAKCVLIQTKTIEFLLNPLLSYNSLILNPLLSEMTPVRFSPGSALTYTLSAYDPTTTVSDNIHLKFKTDNSYSQLMQIETNDPNQYITILIDDGVS